MSLSKPARHHQRSSILNGVVAMVDVGSTQRTLLVRAALSALGATVAPAWSPFVTHVVWSEEGDMEVRNTARLHAARVVSPLWVEACSAANRRVAERNFPPAARRSEIPSPRTMLNSLKQMEQESEALERLLIRDQESLRRDVAKIRMRPIRPTPEDSQDSASTSASSSKTSPPSDDSNASGSTTDGDFKVNTAPRRALPLSVTPEPVPAQAMPRRKLYTQRALLDEPEDSDDSSASDDPVTVKAKPGAEKEPELTHHERTGLDRAERTARRLATATATASSEPAVKTGAIKKTVKKAPTKERPNEENGCRCAQECSDDEYERPISLGNAAAAQPSAGGTQPQQQQEPEEDPDAEKRIVFTYISRSERNSLFQACRELGARVSNTVNARTTHILIGDEAHHSRDYRRHGIHEFRSSKALEGAARGCKVLRSKWALDSFLAGRWLPHEEYIVPCLARTSLKAAIDRHAFGMQNRDFGYNVFECRRVRLSSTARDRSAVESLLALCGAVVYNSRGEVTHNAKLLEQFPDHRHSAPRHDNWNEWHPNDDYNSRPEYDYVIGSRPGEISSRWVFDCVAAGRIKSTTRYINVERRLPVYAGVEVDFVSMRQFRNEN